MLIDSIVKLFDAISRLIGVIVWPFVIFFIVFYFRKSLKEFFSNLGEFSLKGAGFEASAKRKQEAAANLAAALAYRGAAAASRQEIGATTETTTAQVTYDVQPVDAANQVVSQEVTSRVERLAAKAKVLWVDDRTSANYYEKRAFKALGMTIVLAEATDDALAKLKAQTFDVIISDMGRPGDPMAGYTLLDKLRSSGDQTPFLIYTGDRAPEHQAKAKERGAVGYTNRPDELFDLVLSTLKHADS